jgi:predicted transcriptional regulator
MEVVLAEGWATVETVRLNMANPPGYDSVRTTLRILERKGVVTHRAAGRQYEYAPAVSQASARDSVLAFLVKTFFAGRPERAALALLRQSDLDLDEEELGRLERTIREAER